VGLVELTQNTLLGRPVRARQEAVSWLLAQAANRGAKHACAASLKEEINRLRNSLVVVASLKEYGIFWPNFGSEPEWNKEREKETWTWWRLDTHNNNLLIHTYHPRFLTTKRHLNRRCR
jgi:hypothetical protein